MPTYEYECKSCGNRFTKFQSIKDKSVQSCPECSGPVRRIISGGVGVIFKGSGFYTTDYKKDRQISGSCCGQNNSCDNPKRCCEK